MPLRGARSLVHSESVSAVPVLMPSPVRPGQPRRLSRFGQAEAVIRESASTFRSLSVPVPGPNTPPRT